MNLSEPFIRRPIMTTLVMATILLMGLISFYNLPVAALPDVDFPVIQVSAQFTGASPETMATTVAQPLEREFMAIQGIDSVTSKNSLGKTEITLLFDVGKNLDVASVEVQTAISRATINLPKNLNGSPTFKKVNPSVAPIIYIVVSSETMDLSKMYEYASTFIGQRLSLIQGVAQVQTYGSPYALRVNVNPELIALKGVTFADISEAVAKAVPHLPLGNFDNLVSTGDLISRGQILNAKEMNSLVVLYKKGAPVRIRDIGEAIDTLDNYDRVKYYEGDRAVNSIVLGVQKQPQANAIKIAQEVKNKLQELKALMPGSLDIDVVADKSIRIKDSVFDVEITLLLALILVVGVIYVSLGRLADTIIPSLAIPMSILMTFIVMYYFNFTLDSLSLLALTLSTGFVVDDAIVVLENVVRRVEAGEGRWEASIKGAQQISFTILSMTLSLAAVFIPLVFMHGIIGKIFFEFSVVLIVVILASGFISLTLTPMLSSFFVAEKVKGPEGQVEHFSKRLNTVLLNLYRPSLAWVMRRQKVVVFLGALSVLVSIFLFWILPKDLFPSDDMGYIIAFRQSAEGTAGNEIDKQQDQIAEVVKKNKNVQSFVSLADATSISLKPYHEREPVEVVMKELYEGFNQIPGVRVFIKNIPLINLEVGSRGANQYTLTGLNKESLYTAAAEFLEKVKALPGFVGVSSDLEIKTPQIQVEILRDQASALGLSAFDIENALSLAFSKGKVAKINTDFNQYNIILQVFPDFSMNKTALNSIWVRSSTGKMVPLSAVVNWKEITGASSINHLSQFPAVTISFNLKPGTPLSKALAGLEKIAKETLPDDVRGQTQGGARVFESILKSAGFLTLLSIFSIYIVLGILYESFIHPLTILSSLPPAIMGGLATLWLFDLPLTLYGFLGLILLIGIVKKNGIMVVDFALDNIREKGESREQSIVEACFVRFRPIMMTTFAAVFGALPIAYGFGAFGETRRPLGLVIIGGLLFSQLVTLYLTPCVYLFHEKMHEKFMSWNKKI